MPGGVVVDGGPSVALGSSDPEADVPGLDARALLDETSELICAAGPGGRIVYVNRAWQRTLGYTASEAASHAPSDFVAPEHRGMYRELARRLVSGATVDDFEAVLLAKDGRRVVCRGRATPVMRAGRCVATRAVYRDVTAERQSDVLRARLAATLEATSDLVAMVTREGAVVYLNRAIRRLVALPDGAAVEGLRTERLLARGEARRLEALAIPAVMRRGSWEGEARLRAADGEEVPVSMVIVAHPSVREGEPPYFLSAVMRDLRERVRIERALRESEARFRGALENLRALAVTLDAAGRVTFVNDHLLAVSGWTREEAMGADWCERFVAGGCAEQAANVGAPGGGATPAHEERAILTRGGEARLVAWDHVPLRDGAGRLVGTASVGRDVTDERRVRELKDQLIATTSHEVRNPLSAVRGALQLLGRLLALPEGRPRELLEVAQRNTDRVIRLTNDLLDIERVESGTAIMNPVDVDTHALVTFALETVRHSAEQAGVALVHAHDAATPVPAWADVDRITQVLTNLVGNAIKFSPRGGAVTVTAARDGDAVHVAVSDEGRGIPADKLETVFERFAQVRPEDAREKGGAGLGLAICRAIIRQHGGSIWAESVEGAGSTFHFTLPGAGDARRAAGA